MGDGNGILLWTRERAWPHYRIARRTQDTGLQTIAASWQGAVKVRLYERDGIEHAPVEVTLGVGPPVTAGSRAGSWFDPVEQSGLVARLLLPYCFHAISSWKQDQLAANEM